MKTPTRICQWDGVQRRNEISPGGRVRSAYVILRRVLIHSGLFLTTGGLQGFGRTCVVLSDVGGQSSAWTSLCPLIPVSSEEDFRCFGRDPAGHDSGNSVVPLSTPGPQADRGKTAGRRRHHGTLADLAFSQMLVYRPEGRRQCQPTLPP